MAGFYRLVSFAFWILGLLTTVVLLVGRIVRPLRGMLEDHLEFRSLLWLAGVFFLVGGAKLIGRHDMIELFRSIGVGQWLRYVTGSLEVLGAVLLLVPRLSGLGALLLVGVMLGAVPTHLFVVGGSPLQAIILLIVTGVVAWGRRKRTMNILAGLR